MKPFKHVLKKHMWKTRSDAAKNAVIGSGGAHFRSFWVFVDAFEPVLTFIDMRNGGTPSRGLSRAIDRYCPSHELDRAESADAMLLVMRDTNEGGLIDRWLTAQKIFESDGIVQVTPFSVIFFGGRLIFPRLCSDRLLWEYYDKSKLPGKILGLINLMEAGEGAWGKVPPDPERGTSGAWYMDPFNMSGSQRRAVADALDAVSGLWLYSGSDILRSFKNVSRSDQENRREAVKSTNKRAANMEEESPPEEEMPGSGSSSPLEELDAMALLADEDDDDDDDDDLFVLVEMNQDDILPD